MNAYFLWFVLQAVLCGVIITVFWKRFSTSLLPLALLFVLLVPLAFFFGGLARQFESNLCYSTALEKLAKSSAVAVSTANAQDKHAFVEAVLHLPFRGYESSCEEISGNIPALSEAGQQPSVGP